MNTSTAPRESGAKAKAALWRDAGLLLMAIFVILGYGILANDPGSTPVRTLSLIFASIMLEAVPFMLFGALVGGLIEAYVSQERMTAILPKKGWLTVVLAAGMGIIFPVFECAVVPVTRRLARKGLPPAAAIAYLLGGPIVNPIVAASTAMAYRFDWTVVGMRMGFGFLIAVTVALVMGWMFSRKSILRDDIHDDSDHDCGHDHGHDCGHDHGHDCGHDHDPSVSSFRAKLVSAFRYAADDFLSVGHFLVIGAFIAALAQTYIDRKVFLDITDHPMLPTMAMILMAILLNLCSEADAFIAASFRGLMPMPAQMAFMLTGPMLDLKLLLMYQSVFRKRAILALASLILIAVFAVALGMELFGGGPQ
jgi:uncharacterized membrane protein YraQ (UPF0718 family)